MPNVQAKKEKSEVNKKQVEVKVEEESSTSQPTPAEVFGQICWLMQRSPAHRHIFIGDLEWLLTPALMTSQYRVFRNKGVPYAYVSWAHVDDAVEKRLESGVRKFAPADWRSGDKVWVVDLIAAPEVYPIVMKALQEDVFKGKSFKTIEPNAEGGLHIVEYGAKD